MLKKCVILGLALMVVGGLAFAWVRQQAQANRPSEEVLRAQESLMSEDHLAKYEQWHRLTVEEQNQLVLELDKDRQNKSDEQLAIEQKARILKDLDKLAAGQVSPGDIDALSQEAKARHWGVQGGIGLEFRMNRKLGFILMAQGRYARISGFEGTEAAFLWEDQQSNTEFDNGTLYLLEEGEYPQLDIIEGSGAALLKARKAEFDFSGVSFQAGLSFKF